jgi:hypothetical protein
MNARSVSKSAGLRLGIALTSIFFSALPALKAETTITITGTVNGGRDMFGIFAMPGNVIPKGTPYTLVFTFNEAKGLPFGGGPCSTSGSGTVGNGPNSPAVAVLTINGKSYEFGHRPDARSRTWRSIGSSCSNSEIGISVQEGREPLMTGVNIKITSKPGKALTGNKDWRSDIDLSDFDASNGDNAFVIRRPGNFGQETMSYLSVDKVTVKRSVKPAAAGPAKEYAPGFALPKKLGVAK